MLACLACRKRTGVSSVAFCSGLCEERGRYIFFANSFHRLIKEQAENPPKSIMVK